MLIRGDITFKERVMGQIRIVTDENYTGEGISQGLARGLLVYYQDCNLTGEGMGIGSIALRDIHYTYFSRSWTDAVDGEILTRTFFIDTRMIWSIQEKQVFLLTRLIEYATRIYMRLPRAQKILMIPVFPLRTLLGIHPVFETISPLGKVRCTYKVNGNDIEVEVCMEDPLKEHEILFLLNELSARWFTDGCEKGRQTYQIPAWERISSVNLPVSLFDPVHRIRFFLNRPSVPDYIPFSVYRGREHTEDLCWAGFCIQLGPSDTKQILPKVGYRISFSEEKCSSTITT